MTKEPKWKIKAEKMLKRTIESYVIRCKNCEKRENRSCTFSTIFNTTRDLKKGVRHCIKKKGVRVLEINGIKL